MLELNERLGARRAAVQTDASDVVARRAIPGKRLTYDEFLPWCDQDTCAEWGDGEVQMASPALPAEWVWQDPRLSTTRAVRAPGIQG